MRQISQWLTESATESNWAVMGLGSVAGKLRQPVLLAVDVVSGVVWCGVCVCLMTSKITGVLKRKKKREKKSE